MCDVKKSRERERKNKTDPTVVGGKSDQTNMNEMSVWQKIKIGDFVDGKRVNEKTSDCVPFVQQDMQNVTVVEGETHDQCLNAASQNSKETSDRFPNVLQ